MTDPTLTFATQEAWDAWLDQHGSTSSGVWLRLAKKSASKATVSYVDALECALCYGWIDGKKQSESAHYWLQRFTPRAARSIWSQINKEKSQALVASGRMRPACCRSSGPRTMAGGRPRMRQPARRPCPMTCNVRWMPIQKLPSSLQPSTAATATPSCSGCTTRRSPKHAHGKSRSLWTCWVRARCPIPEVPGCGARPRGC